MSDRVNEAAVQLREWIGEEFVHQSDADKVIEILDAALATERATAAVDPHGMSLLREAFEALNLHPEDYALWKKMDAYLARLSGESE